mmetsp:Transcript_13454/g.18418  ORF Transcript_13454/g.18418 Transcript_13454/m.18418 type:complete len:287 (-) Transcript_13454:83-943(-)|eukprot:CAMPEP_0196579064 /NCGR_PEP_ID=MMETSP1081-20130531/17165_1 /TAXON_ID=36882 /ORGANISM="Pyramimonas amylifera, Strain CCMP720" /LENGTH=286 /DNA_ID=CAMNT_0041898513 /DNA_START=50 /DNA_END=910 /DNA_ORIENTATION=+
MAISSTHIVSQQVRIVQPSIRASRASRVVSRTSPSASSPSLQACRLSARASSPLVSLRLSTAKPARGAASGGRTGRLIVLASNNVIIAGAPASGKGTQCEGIVDAFDLVHISTGDMLRAAVAAGTEAGKEAQEYMSAGKLVPDEVIIAMVKDRLGEEDCAERGWLLDGFPRTGVQAQALKDINVSPDHVLLLDVPDEAIIARVVGRRSDPDTGKIYHVDFMPPPPEVAERCIQRADDTEEACRSRLTYYYNNLEAIKEAYADKIKVINGNQDKLVVGEAIKAAMTS